MILDLEIQTGASTGAFPKRGFSQLELIEVGVGLG